MDGTAKEKYVMEAVISKASRDDLAEILQLQYKAFYTVAESMGDFSIPPLTQTIEELVEEYMHGVVLKLVCDGKIVGSVRVRVKGDTVYVGKLIVSPDYRHRGFATRLLAEVEKLFPEMRYELFTSVASPENIRLYEKNGYVIFDRKTVSPNLTFVYMEKIRN